MSREEKLSSCEFPASPTVVGAYIPRIWFPLIFYLCNILNLSRKEENNMMNCYVLSLIFNTYSECGL